MTTEKDIRRHIAELSGQNQALIQIQKTLIHLLIKKSVIDRTTLNTIFESMIDPPTTNGTPALTDVEFREGGNYLVESFIQSFRETVSNLIKDIEVVQ